ncbi:MAG: DUF2232 domain-containing protein, partial [Bacillota bacterium]|nr:DUF2232 domain-containing protein [Bacillota bacterium]
MRRAGRPDTLLLVEGALLAAITVILATVGLYLPIGYLSLVIPVPIIVLVYRHGLEAGILVSVVAALLTGVLSHVLQGTVMVLALAAVGLAIGEAMRGQLTPGQVVAVGTAASLVVTLLTLGLVFWLFGINELAELSKLLEESLRLSGDFYLRLGLVKPEQLKQWQEALLHAFRTLLPSSLLLSAALTVYVNHWLAQKVLYKLGQPTPGFPPFAEWRLPALWRWPGVLLLAAAVGMHLLPSPVAKAAGSNLLLLLAVIYYVQGLSILWFFLRQYRVSGFLRVVILLLALFN